MRIAALLLLLFLASHDGAAAQRGSGVPANPQPPAAQAGEIQRQKRLIREAQLLIRDGKHEEALARLSEGNLTGQHAEAAKLLRGTCLRKLGRFGEARALYQGEIDACRERGEDPTPMLVELQRASREAGDAKAAFDLCLEIDRGGAAHSEWVRDELESLIVADSAGNWVVPALRKEIRTRPEAQNLPELLISSLLSFGKDAEALEEARALDRAREGRGLALLEQLRRIAQKGTEAQVVAFAEAAVAAGLGDDPAQEALYLKASALRRAGRHREAVAAFDDAVKASPEGALARMSLKDRADVLVRDLRDFESGAAAQEDLIAVLEKTRGSERGRLLGQALVALAETRLRMGRYEDVVAVCKRIEDIAADPVSREEAAFQQAEVLFYAGKIEEAQGGYERMTRDFAGGDRVNDALERLLLLSRVGEAGAVPLAALGQIAYQRRIGQHSRALEICEEASRACDGCEAAQDILREEGLSLLDLGRLEEAAARADTLAARYPDGGMAAGVLRAVADRMRERDGESEAVIRRYEDLLVRFPRSYEALEVRSLLQKLRRTGSLDEPRAKEGRA